MENKSFLFCTMFIDSKSSDHSYQRYEKWIDYYSDLKRQLGFSQLFLIDDGSDSNKLEQNIAVYDAENLPSSINDEISIIKFQTNKGRTSVFEYPGWWRSFLFSFEIATKYKYSKIIHIESDFFLLSSELISFINGSNKGWISLFSDFYQFPETAVQVICEDSYCLINDLKDKLIINGYLLNYPAEMIIPFTHVEIGEPEVLDEWIKTEKYLNPLDYIGQVPAGIELKRYIELFKVN